MSTVGNRIRCARESLGITQEQLGKLCDTTKQTIFKYENDIVTNIPMDRVEAIAHHLRIAPAYLMGWSNTQQPTQTPTPIPKLSTNEQELVRKFRQLDDRGKAAVLNVLDHEYAALPQTASSADLSPADEAHHILRIAARDGSYVEHNLTEEQAAALDAYLDELPDVPAGL